MTKLDADQVIAWTTKYLTDFLDLPPEAFDLDAEFAALGLDSVDSVIIGGAFEETFNCEIDATLFLRNANLRSLIDDLRQSGLVA
ncbi:hypothetical protein GCM10011452_03480 [Gemmobacter lanyuensis]|uniref:Carrier domain-containing protein n=1 Tax=Gemmobacter lanyuensis TaxID=1054497 RepID=A0A918MH14_9RHOB|nr:acyl carrier protein [Gemmobacter lanyuensis]GGW21732.1 hypothetical protein GCM10011452_03480 [Gemmobacter lanyuensis]